MSTDQTAQVPVFSRGTWDSGAIVSRIGPGRIGGKAAGLWQMSRDLLDQVDHAAFPEFEVTIPRMVVLGTGLFEAFMDLNGLWDIALSGASDARIAHAFRKATIPPEHLGDLRDFVTQVQGPLAVRSSSLMEDMLNHPFAGVYGTKMIPNNAIDADTRFTRLVESIRFIYANTFTRAARNYFEGTDRDHADERMAVVIQEVVGNRHGDRFYPEISGVARTFNYYPSGGAAPTEGVVSLALGLGRQIVDGDLCWGYCPARPAAPPPFNDVGDRLRGTQTSFWAVNMGPPPPPDPMGETEFLVRPGLLTAEKDGVLDHLVSTYDPASDRLRLGLGAAGPRVLDFGPLLVGETLPLNALVSRLLPLAERVAGCPVEIEFAIDRRPDGRHRFCLLQMRAMLIPSGDSKVSVGELNEPGVVLASEQALGHGVREDISDIVYIRPDTFAVARTREIAAQVEKLNAGLLAEGRPYLLLGFGRWGSADPWLGVPVDWGQISGARVIVETSYKGLNPDPSQGTHFFHNLIAFQVLYMTVRGSSGRIDWDWLEAQPLVQETGHLRHVRTAAPLSVRLDGVAGLGVVQAKGQG